MEGLTMNSYQARYDVANDVLDSWRESLLTGTPPTLYRVGSGELERLELGPRRVMLVGGAPGAGKTAFTMQVVVDALRLTPTLKACVCNVEMPAEVLLDRQLARLSGISLTTIRQRQFDEMHVDRIDTALSTLEPVADRLCFVRPPFDLLNVAATADAFGADLIVLDYIQRIPAPGKHADRRGSVDATMNYIRQFADAGAALIVVAAVARTKDTRGRSSYDGGGLTLASFRESSELEFGADDAFILLPPNEEETKVTLRHLKARYSETKDLTLEFDRRLQRFTSPVSKIADAPNAGSMRAALASLWEKTNAAPDEYSEEEDR
jgi:replicative DNA helicase